MKTLLPIHLITLLLIASIGTVQPSQAQSRSIKHYTTADGLPGNVTYKLAQDEEGYLWISTDNGICRFDGLEFKTYNSPLIKNNEILGLSLIHI